MSARIDVKIKSKATVLKLVSENQGFKSLSTKLNSSLNFIFHAPLSDKQIILKQIMLNER